MKTPYEVHLETEVDNLRRLLAEVTVGDRDDLWRFNCTQTISPTEESLRHELQQAREVINQLRRSESPLTYFSPQDIEVHDLSPTVRLAVAAGYRATKDFNYHIWAKERGATREQFNIGYYITDPAMMTLPDRSAALAYTMERVVRELAETMHKEKT